MHRFGKYIVTALITFTIGLVCSFLTRGEMFSSKHVQEVPAVPVEVESSPERVSVVGGHGLTSDRFETLSFEYKYSDGSYLNQLMIFYGSTERAHAELEKRLQQASNILLRKPMLDEKGRHIGERVIATFPPQNESAAPSAELLWTEHSTFAIQRRRSLKDLMHAFDAKR